MNFIKIFTVLTLLISASTDIVLGANIPEPEAREQWSKFKAKFNRRYGTPEDASRYDAFKSNLNKIAELNQENKHVNGEEPFAVTQFSDLWPEEFSKIFLTYTHPNSGGFNIQSFTPSKLKSSAPPNFSWGEKGALTPIKDQGRCGSCWAFSVVEELESAIFISQGVLPLLSAQQVNSCSVNDSGCQGGDTISALNYMVDKGVELESSYPYTSGSGYTGRCTYDRSKVVATMSGYRYAVPSCAGTGDCRGQAAFEPELKKQIAEVGPASICLDASTWQNYAGGIIAPTSCQSNWGAMDHCVQLTGYATPENGPAYWIVRNQWGQSFGENGNLRLQMGSNTCGMANQVTFINDATFSGPIPVPPPIPIPPPPSPIPSPTTSPCPVPTPKPSPPTPAPKPTCPCPTG